MEPSFFLQEDIEIEGYYWTVDAGTDYSAMFLYFTGVDVAYNSGNRYSGYAVRLVCDAPFTP